MKFVITGYSRKRDGFIFVCDAEDREAAIKEMERIDTSRRYLKVPNEKTDASWRDQEFVEVFIDNDVSEDEIDWEEGTPRRSGWEIYIGKSPEPSGFVHDAVCW